MQVNDQLVQKLAKLSKLSFSETEKAAIQTDLERMIKFVQKMEEVNTHNIEPLLHMSDAVNVSRKDSINGTCNHERALLNATVHDNQFFLVPKVIKK